MTKTKTNNTSTRAERLLRILEDGKWHSTKELIRRVGHTFAGAKFMLVHKGTPIEIRPHPKRKRAFQYRLKRKRASWLPPLAVRNQGGRTGKQRRTRRTTRAN